MKVFVSTKETQGQRDNDFCFCKDGEILEFSPICGKDIASIDGDGPCGCGRALTSLVTGKGTTTFKIEDLDLSKEDLVYLIKSRYVTVFNLKENQARDIAIEETNRIIRLSEKYENGDILEFRGLQGLKIRVKASEKKVIN